MHKGRPLTLWAIREGLNSSVLDTMLKKGADFAKLWEFEVEETELKIEEATDQATAKQDHCVNALHEACLADN